MKYRQDLSAAQHVARREALAQIERGAELQDGFYRLMALIMPTCRDFMMRSRLDGAGFERLVREVRSLVEGFGPPVLREFRRPPTRSRPKGEEHEFITVIRSGDEDGVGRSGYELAGLRVLLTRRRIEFAFERNGLFVTRHALERSIERGLASWSGRLAETEDAMLENLGLVLAWRRAYETGRTPSTEMVLPWKGGLILASMEPTAHPLVCMGLGVASARTQKLSRVPSALAVEPARAEASTRTDTVICTVLDEDLLTTEQVDMRDALGRVASAHKGALGDIAVSALWRTATNFEATDPAALMPGLDLVADDLARLLECEGAREAIRADRVRTEPREPAKPVAGAFTPARMAMLQDTLMAGPLGARVAHRNSSARFRAIRRAG